MPKTHKLSQLAKRCGYWSAARHAANRGMDFEQAYILIFFHKPRKV